MKKIDLPKALYHGTNNIAYQQIISERLKPMGQNLVHLISFLNDAKTIRRLHKRILVILEVDIKSAVEAGIQIWQVGNTVYVSNFIPKEYIKRIN